MSQLTIRALVVDLLLLVLQVDMDVVVYVFDDVGIRIIVVALSMMRSNKAFAMPLLTNTIGSAILNFLINCLIPRVEQDSLAE